MPSTPWTPENKGDAHSTSDLLPGRSASLEFAGLVEQQVAKYRAAGDTAGEAAFLEWYYCRMWNVSGFMHGVKQRFTQWYNGRKGRKGTLWGDRFKSVVVEGARGTVRGALRREAVLKVLREKGKLPLVSYMRCRVRTFCDGLVFGSKEFVEMFRERRVWS